MRAPIACALLLLAFTWAMLLGATYAAAHERGGSRLDRELQSALAQAGFTGTIEATLEQRLANVGRLLWFDPITGLNDDNSCAGCHSPTSGFADTQSIAIGSDNNGVVGPGRAGPRNMRRSPTVINSAYDPALMWNGRFFARSGDPFDNRAGLVFPPPEGEDLSHFPHLNLVVREGFFRGGLALPAPPPAATITRTVSR